MFFPITTGLGATYHPTPFIVKFKKTTYSQWIFQVHPTDIHVSTTLVTHLTSARSKLSGDGIEEVTCSLTAADTVGTQRTVVGRTVVVNVQNDHQGKKRIPSLKLTWRKTWLQKHSLKREDERSTSNIPRNQPSYCQRMMARGVLHHRNETQVVFIGSMKPFSEGEPGSLG